MKKYLALALLIVATPTIASTFPTGNWVSMDGEEKLSIYADGEYEVRYPRGGKTYTSKGQALLDYGCTWGETKKGNLWVIGESGSGICYNTTVTGGKLVIQKFGEYGMLGGIWVKAHSR